MRAFAIVLALVTWIGGARADGGLHATGRVPSAAPGPAIAVAVDAGYGYTGDVLAVNDAHHRVGGGLAAAWRVVPWLELGLDLRGRFDKATGDEPDSGLVGDPRLWLRGGRSIARGTWLGARLGLWLPGGDAPSVQLDAASIDVAGLVTWAPDATRVSAVVGYRVDRSYNAVDYMNLSRSDRVGLGWSDKNALLLGVEVAHTVGPWQPRAELSGELRVGAAADDGSASNFVSKLTSPMRAGVGLRRALTSALTAEAAVDVGLSSRPDSSLLDSSGLVPIEPRVTATVGLTWRQPAPRPRVVLPEIVVTPPVDPEPPPVDEPPPPPPTGALRGRVVDDGGSPLPGATVKVGEQSATTDDDGGFTIAGLPPGDVEVTIERPGHEPLRQTFTIVADAPGAPVAAMDVVLARVRPPSQIRGVIRSFDGVGLAATIMVQPLGAEAVAGADGRFAIDVPPGAYKVVVSLAGYQSQTRNVTVEVEGVAITNIELRKARR